MNTLFGQILHKRGTEAKIKDVVLAESELGYNKTTKRLKVGDGTTTFENLDTIAYVSDIPTSYEDIEAQVTFSSRLEFPNVGNPTKLYVAVDENKTYRWDDTNLIYCVVGSDYNDIEIIDCGGASR